MVDNATIIDPIEERPMARDQAITELSKKRIPGVDPTGRDIMARQFAAALADPTGREVIARQCAAKVALPLSLDQ